MKTGVHFSAIQKRGPMPDDRPERPWLGDDLPDTHAEDTYAREHARLVEARPPAGVDGSVFPC